jgi:chromosome segregation protein
VLKLRRIEIIGFKSFHDRSEIMIGENGVTAVVGPNGCGKSNISDAVAWVLGEQRARSLRGDRMEDVIFNGTGKRAPLGMAEVSISLLDEHPLAATGSNGDGHRNGNGNGNGNGNAGPPPGPVELTVQRRLFRSGESQYLLNGRPCRLRDIQDIFLGTGLGPNSYAIVEQGRIGQILSARPADRRTIVEEAAGITRFKAKRKLAESRLQAAEKNLARVSDILSEVDRQRNSLKRQAGKARRYREVRQRLRQVLAGVFSTRAEVLIAGQDAVVGEMAAMAGEGRGLDERIAVLDRRVHAAREDVGTRERRLEEARERRGAGQLDLEKAGQSIERQQERVRSLDTRTSDLTSDLERLELELTNRRTSIESSRDRESGIERDQELVSSEMASSEAVLADLGRRKAEEERALEAARGRRIDIVGREAELGNEIGAKDALLERVRAHAGRIEEERDEAREAVGKVAGEVRSVEAERRELETGIERLARESETSEERIGAAHAANEAAATALAEARSAEEAVRHRLATIRELSVERAYGTESLQDFFSSVRDEPWAPMGIVADFIDVEAGYEALVENLLHVELQYIVVGDLSQASRALDRARESRGGHLDFFVLEADRRELPTPDSVAGARPIAELLRFDPRLESFARTVGGAYVVDDFRSAWDLSRLHAGKTFVARSGEVVRDRVVSWGERSGHGPLSLRREMRELDRRGEELRRAVVVAGEHSESAQARLDGVRAERESLRSRIRDAETEVLGLDHRLGILRSELERSQQRLRVSSGELERLADEARGLEEGMARARSEIAGIRETRSAIDAEITERTEASTRLAGEAERSAAHLAELRAKQAVLLERAGAVRRELETLSTQVGELTGRREWTTGQIETAREQRAAALRQIDDDASRRDALAAELDRLREQIEGDLEFLETSRRDLREAESGWDEARRALDAWKDRRNTAEIRKAEIESDLKHLVSSCQSELGEPIESVCLDTFETLGPDDLAAYEEEHRILRQRLDAMGNVNMMAVEEYEEAEQRFEFLSTQRQDLIDSIRDTSQAIREIDSVCSRQFSEAFREVNERFRQSFVDLFGGGHGELRLIQEKDKAGGENADAGIEIVAQPPGKKLQNVLLLSGGEKALTALSLVIALFRFRPSPFCVLDEVDAPLDDANVDRFANMIRLMSEETQFIVITHSKRTMETANQLYGVTMQEPGVSKVVSVRLN